MLIPILIVVAVLIVAFIAFVASRPSDFRVTRSALISGPPELAFEQVNDLHNFHEWSPWAKMDPNCRTVFDGPTAGPGASFSWSGKKVGQGRMTQTENRPNELIRFRLDFEKPFKGTNIAEFTFKPEGSQTVVTWSMSGKYNFVMKAMGLILNCDKMCGDQFEKGLADMDALVKSRAAQTGNPVGAR